MFGKKVLNNCYFMETQVEKYEKLVKNTNFLNNQNYGKWELSRIINKISSIKRHYLWWWMYLFNWTKVKRTYNDHNFIKNIHLIIYFIWILFLFIVELYLFFTKWGFIDLLAWVWVSDFWYTFKFMLLWTGLFLFIWLWSYIRNYKRVEYKNIYFNNTNYIVQLHSKDTKLWN